MQLPGDATRNPILISFNRYLYSKRSAPKRYASFCHKIASFQNSTNIWFCGLYNLQHKVEKKADELAGKVRRAGHVAGEKVERIQNRVQETEQKVKNRANETGRKMEHKVEEVAARTRRTVDDKLGKKK